MNPFQFYLGIHKPHWLARAYIPLFVSRRSLKTIKRKFPIAAACWALDSGGFTELSQFGRWTTGAREYAAEAIFWSETIGRLDWCAAQDWMCEPAILKKTGKSIREHQALTIANYLELRDLAPKISFTPVIQGFERDDYLRHVDDYAAAGIDLRTLPRVGIGSVCRRQHTSMVESLIGELAGGGIKLHAFGFKLKGLKSSWRNLASADSMAWSFDARYADLKLSLCPHPRCNNCLAFAAKFRQRVIQECVGDYEICPECGSTDVAAPNNGDWSWSCPGCGHNWPMMITNEFNGFHYCQHERSAA